MDPEDVVIIGKLIERKLEQIKEELAKRNEEDKEKRKKSERKKKSASRKKESSSKEKDSDGSGRGGDGSSSPSVAGSGGSGFRRFRVRSPVPTSGLGFMDLLDMFFTLLFKSGSGVAVLPEGLHYVYVFIRGKSHPVRKLVCTCTKRGWLPTVAYFSAGVVGNEETSLAFLSSLHVVAKESASKGDVTDSIETSLVVDNFLHIVYTIYGTLSYLVLPRLGRVMRIGYVGYIYPRPELVQLYARYRTNRKMGKITCIKHRRKAGKLRYGRILAMYRKTIEEAEKRGEPINMISIIDDTVIETGKIDYRTREIVDEACRKLVADMDRTVQSYHVAILFDIGKLPILFTAGTCTLEPA